MKPITLLQPPRIAIGNGCAPECVGVLVRRGVRRVLLVSSTPVLPMLASVLNALEAAKIEVVKSSPVDSEPTRASFEAVLEAARKENIDGVLGIGGGSASVSSNTSR